MHSRTSHQWRSPMLVTLLVLLISVLIPARSQPVSAQQVVDIDPSTLTVTAPLGTQVTRTIRLTNSSGAALAPLVFEAEATPAVHISGAADAAGPRAVALPEQEDRIDEQLLDAFSSSDGERVDFLIFLHDQADLSAAYAIEDWSERGSYVYQTLVEHAERSQRDLRAQLAARGITFQSFWIANALLVHGTEADAQALASRADVALVRANRVTEIPSNPGGVIATDDNCSPDQPGNPVCWHIRKIQANRVWNDFGVTGAGIVVANIDTGVWFAHPALAQQYRGNLGGGRYDHNYNWFDPSRSRQHPFDETGHGTHTMGTIAGRGNGTSSQPTVGVAPGVRWIAAQGCKNLFCAESDLIGSAQWLLAPTALNGTLPRPDLRAMIVNNSWAGPGGENWYAGYTAAWRAAGMFPVFAAGNGVRADMQPCGSVGSPGDYADVVAVGATDKDDRIAGFSLIGPTKDGRLKPDLVAPGTLDSFQRGIVSTARTDSPAYVMLQGTSMATPQVAGLVALLWSANPTLIGDYATTYSILTQSARRISETACGGQAGAPNNVYGYGRIDAYAAVARARVDIPWLGAPSTLAALPANSSSTFSITFNAARVPGPGSYKARLLVYSSGLGQAPRTVTITMNVTPVAEQAVVSGRITSAETGAPVRAVIGVKDGLGVETDSQGAYSLTLAFGTYELVATAPSFITKRETVALNAPRQLDLVMHPDLPRISVAAQSINAELAFPEQRKIALPVSNSGTQSLYYNVQVLPDQFGVWRSDEPDGPTYQWVDLPAHATRLDFKNKWMSDELPMGIDFPLASFTVTQTFVTSDGMLTFNRSIAPYQGLTNACLPDESLFFYVLAPFRANLDPTRGGSVRYGTVTIDGLRVFVVSFEDVPLRTGSAQATYTFQALLRPDGRVTFQYKQLAQLPGQLSVGYQRAPLNIQSIGCGATTPISAGLALEWRPQPSVDQWLSSSITTDEIMPNAQKQTTLTLSWMRPNGRWPLRGRIQITSNDPMRSQIIIPVEMHTLPAPHEQWLLYIFR